MNRVDIPGAHTAHPINPIRGVPHPPGAAHSDAGNCACGRNLDEDRHTEAAPGVPARYRHLDSGWLP